MYYTTIDVVMKYLPFLVLLLIFTFLIVSELHCAEVGGLFSLGGLIAPEGGVRVIG
jgi:hypothetical protein